MSAGRILMLLPHHLASAACELKLSARDNKVLPNKHIQKDHTNRYAHCVVADAECYALDYVAYFMKKIITGILFK